MGNFKDLTDMKFNMLTVIEQAGKERGRMSEIKLKPCPFCGGEAEIFGSEVVVFVGCKECSCITEWDDDISAERGWNKRVGQDGE